MSPHTGGCSSPTSGGQGGADGAEGEDGAEGGEVDSPKSRGFVGSRNSSYNIFLYIIIKMTDTHCILAGKESIFWILHCFLCQTQN